VRIVKPTDDDKKQPGKQALHERAEGFQNQSSIYWNVYLEIQQNY
jgi:hypothetical protein